MAEFGKLNFSVSFNPTSGFPLDARYYFDSKSAADTAAAGAVEVGSADGTYFIGQNIVVVEESAATLYVIQPDKTLKAVGTTPLGDNKTIEVSSDGTISLLGIADAQTGAYPTKKADGSIEWVKPDTTTIEGITQEVEALGGRMDDAESDISALETTVGNADSGLVKQVNDLSTNLSENYYDKDDVDGLVAGAFHFKGQADSFDGTDIIIDETPVSNMKNGDVYQVGDKEYVYDGTKWIELGFNLDLSNYALKTYVDSAVGAAKTELQSYADQAEADALSAAKSYTDGKITELGIGDYAKTSEVTSAIDSAKTELKSYADQAEADAITAAGTNADSKIAAQVGDIGENTVKQYVDAKESALSGQISSIQGSIDNLGDLAALDEVGESNLASALASKINGKADKATTLEGYGITDAMTATAITDAISTAKSEAISSAVATAGTNADSKIAAKVGTIDGTVKDYVDGKETALSGQIGTINSTISGYGDIVTHNASEFDAAGAAAGVLGTAEDASTANTVYGAKKAAAEALTAAQSAQSAADGKVASVTGADNSVVVTTGTNPTVKVNVDPAEDNALKLGASGLKVEMGAAPEYVIEKEATADEGYVATYILKKDGVQAGEKINIPKDYLVKSASIEESEGDGDPSGLPAGTKYIDFVVNTKEGSGTETHIYLNVNELVDAYTAGNGITVSASNEISAKVVDGNGLSVDASGIKMGAASGTAAGAMSAEHFTKLDGIESGAQVNDIENISIDGTNLEITGKTVALPAATAARMGLVKPDNTSIEVDGSGVISVKEVNVMKLAQTDGDLIILDCGGAS